MSNDKYNVFNGPNRLINVLDHGYVRLVDHMGSDLSIVRAARVSYDADWRTGENEKSDEKLIRYLMKNDHSTPFEAVTMTLEVQAPLFVFRQWHRHRTQSYNEVSARYTLLPDLFYIPEPESIGIQSNTNKQMRLLEDNDYKDVITNTIKYHSEESYRRYEYLIEMGTPRELARMVLPTNIYSRQFTTMNLHNAFHFLKRRLHSHAQNEIREYAYATLELIEKFVAPVATAAFKQTILLEEGM